MLKGISLQGGESGGHGRKGGATTLCLLPEVMDAVDAACAQHGLPRIPVLAAGGICDGRQARRPAAPACKGAGLACSACVTLWCRRGYRTLLQPSSPPAAPE